MAIIKMQGLTVEQRLKLLEVATKDTDKFYGFLSLMLCAFAAPLGFLVAAYARRIHTA